MQVIICVKYVLRKWNEKKKLDEDGLPIRNQFSYFKTLLENNLKRMPRCLTIKFLRHPLFLIKINHKVFR